MSCVGFILKQLCKSQSIWEQKQLIHVWWGVSSCCKSSYCIPDVLELQTELHKFAKSISHKRSSNNLWPSTKNTLFKMHTLLELNKDQNDNAQCTYGYRNPLQYLHSPPGVWDPQNENLCSTLKSRTLESRATWQKFQVQKGMQKMSTFIEHMKTVSLIPQPQAHTHN